MPNPTGALAASRLRSQRTMLLSWMDRWKDIGGIAVASGCLVGLWLWLLEEEEEVEVSGGRKCEGAMERVVQEGSAAVTRGGPLRMAMDSEMDWERSRSWEERKEGVESWACAGGLISEDVAAEGVAGDSVSFG